MNLLTYIKNINPYLLILDILFLIVSFLFFNKKKCSQRIKDLFIILYTIEHIFLFKYINNFFNIIFSFSQESIKVYLLNIVFAYIIFLFTINKKGINKKQKIVNHLLFIISNITLFINLYIILTIKISLLPNIETITYTDLNKIMIIIVYSYLIITAIIYIINSSKTLQTAQKEIIMENEEQLLEESNELTEQPLLTVEELLNYNRNNPFYINGIDCSIIFNDSNSENIIKNYYILTTDIDAKLVNGYTLNENIMLKNICEKLNTNNLMDINLDNFNILNKISIEEYNLLKKIKNY